MPLNIWKTVKRALKDDLRIDIMGTEQQLRDGLKQHGEFQYEVGEFINSSAENITFLRVTDLETLCSNSVSELKSAGLLEKNANDISLLICGDKGGS